MCTIEVVRWGIVPQRVIPEVRDSNMLRPMRNDWVRSFWVRNVESETLVVKKISTRMSTYLKDRRNVCTREYTDDRIRTCDFLTRLFI